MGAGFVAASLLGSLGGQPAGAFQATFNMQVPNHAGNSRTFTFGGNSDLYTEMTVGSLSSIGGTNVGVSTLPTPPPGPGLCVVRSGCNIVGSTPASTNAVTFSFSKPVELGLGNNFKIGRNQTDVAWGADVGLVLFYNGLQQGNIILLDDPNLIAGTSFRFDSKVLVAANTAITVGLFCSGASCSYSDSNQFYISDVIVEVPAPLPLIGTGAAFAWTRRLRRRIKATPRPIMNG
jgi:hypothetical protein